MSNVIMVAPELMTSAAMDLATIGSNLTAAHTAAAAPTLTVMPAAADEVSQSIAQLFSRHAQDYQAMAGQAAAFQERFVQNLTASASSYASSEAANASLLRSLHVTSNPNVGANPVRSTPAATTPNLFLTEVEIALILMPFLGAALFFPWLFPLVILAGILLLLILGFGV